jgi:hypothetical protein
MDELKRWAYHEGGPRVASVKLHLGVVSGWEVIRLARLNDSPD